MVSGQGVKVGGASWGLTGKYCRLSSSSSSAATLRFTWMRPRPAASCRCLRVAASPASVSSAVSSYTAATRPPTTLKRSLTARHCTPKEG